MRDLIKAQMLRERTYVVFYVNTEKLVNYSKKFKSIA